MGWGGPSGGSRRVGVVGSGELAAAAGGEADGAEGEEAESGRFRDCAGFDADALGIFEGPFVDCDGAWGG